MEGEGALRIETDNPTASRRVSLKRPRISIISARNLPANEVPSCSEFVGEIGRACT